jgi:Na+-transporting methylmalonyl-CoA/oxaloacetate decarboxylase gamma subunit
MGVGMMMVFLVLMVLMGIIVLLSKIFPEKEQLPIEDGDQRSQEVEPGILAVIAAALSSIVPAGSRGQGSYNSEYHNDSPWQLYGRRHLMDVGQQHPMSKRDVTKFSSDLKRRWQLRGHK